jgi:hypothetical protein
MHAYRRFAYDPIVTLNSDFCVYDITVYLVQSSSHVIIQQRAPCVQVHTKAFAESFIKLLQSCTYKHLLVLCGASTNGLPDEILTRSQLHTISENCYL